jgi:hypothetical protein
VVWDAEQESTRQQPDLTAELEQVQTAQEFRAQVEAQTAQVEYNAEAIKRISHDVVQIRDVRFVWRFCLLKQK